MTLRASALLFACFASAPIPPGDELRLPSRLAPAELATVLAEGGASVVDVRPAWQHAEYAIRGSKNLAPEALLAHVRTLPRETLLVLVDTDGSDAFACAGALLARTEHPRIAVLAGGVARWYRERELDRGTREPSVPTPTTETRKKRNAGC